MFLLGISCSVYVWFQTTGNSLNIVYFWIIGKNPKIKNVKFLTHGASTCRDIARSAISPTRPEINAKSLCFGCVFRSSWGMSLHVEAPCVKNFTFFFRVFSYDPEIVECYQNTSRRIRTRLANTCNAN